MFKRYVIATRADLDPGDVKIVGPFDHAETAAKWGRLWQDNNGDNPCWQTVTLPDGFVPSITAP